MRFDHITILTRNMKDSWLFYRRLPKSEIKLPSDDGYFEVLFCETAIGVFDFVKFAEISDVNNTGQGGVILQFLVEDVDEYWKRLPEMYRINATAPRKMPWGSYSAYISDPDGNILEFYRW